MNRPTTFCVIHDREWTGEQGEACPWCEIERLRAVLTTAKAFVEHVPPTDCTQDTWFLEMERYVEQRKGLEAALKVAVEAAEERKP